MQGIGFSSNSSSIGPEPLSRVTAGAGTESSISGSKSPLAGGGASGHFAPDPEPVIKFTAIEAQKQGGASGPPEGANPPGRTGIDGGVSAPGGVAGEPTAELTGRTGTTAGQIGGDSTAMVANPTASALSTRISAEA
jgi:hypothetical protein